MIQLKVETNVCKVSITEGEMKTKVRAGESGTVPW